MSKSKTKKSTWRSLLLSGSWNFRRQSFFKFLVCAAVSPREFQSNYVVQIGMWTYSGWPILNPKERLWWKYVVCPWKLLWENSFPIFSIRSVRLFTTETVKECFPKEFKNRFFKTVWVTTPNLMPQWISWWEKRQTEKVPWNTYGTCRKNPVLYRKMFFHGRNYCRSFLKIHFPRVRYMMILSIHSEWRMWFFRLFLRSFNGSNSFKMILAFP